jgi:hypothetical protein
MLNVPEKGSATLIRVAKESSELASKCAKKLNTTKLYVVFIAIQEFYEKYVKDGDDELVSERN